MNLGSRPSWRRDRARAAWRGKKPRSKRASSPGYPPQKKHRAENVLVAVGLPHHHGVGVGDLAGRDNRGLGDDGGDGGHGGHGVCVRNTSFETNATCGTRERVALGRRAWCTNADGREWPKASPKPTTNQPITRTYSCHSARGDLPPKVAKTRVLPRVLPQSLCATTRRPALLGHRHRECLYRGRSADTPVTCGT